MRQLRDLDTTATGNRWVAVLGQWRKGCLRLPLPYVQAIEHAGAEAKVLSPFELLPSEQVPEGLEIATELDPYDPSPLDGASGLLLCGGGDVDPDLYGQQRHPRTHNVSQKRDRFELTYLGAALAQDMPVFAICRGMQLLNVHLGGSLDQHLLDTPDRIDHYRDVPLSDASHHVELKETCPVADAMGGPKQSVNTHHHQGLGVVAASLEEVGWCSEDGVLEAVVSREHSWVVGVQWHPEAMVDTHEPQQRLFDVFVEATRSFAGAEQPSDVEARSA